MSIGVIDYGMGNLRSVVKGFEHVGADARVCDDGDMLLEFGGLVLPGVGAFGDAMRHLVERRLLRPLIDFIAAGRPLLGICLGMQLLFEYSEEHGRFEGLGVIPGGVVRLPGTVKVPHMGWNALEVVKNVPLFEGIESGSMFYFVHSYYCAPRDGGNTAGTTPYGLDFTSAAVEKNVLGLQFHPEKSSRLGLSILANFSRMVSGGTGGL